MKAIAGATQRTYTTPALQIEGTYWVTVANSAGSVTSDRATVTVVHEEPALALSTVDGIPALTIAGSPGIPYRIECSTDIAAGAWSTVADVVLGGTALTVLDPDGAAGPARFCRIVVP